MQSSHRNCFQKAIFCNHQTSKKPDILQEKHLEGPQPEDISTSSCSAWELRLNRLAPSVSISKASHETLWHLHHENSTGTAAWSGKKACTSILQHSSCRIQQKKQKIWKKSPQIIRDHTFAHLAAIAFCLGAVVPSTEIFHPQRRAILTVATNVGTLKNHRDSGVKLRGIPRCSHLVVPEDVFLGRPLFLSWAGLEEVVKLKVSKNTWFFFSDCCRTNNVSNIEPHEAVPEVSKGKVHITQNKHVPIEWFVTTASQSRIWLNLFSDDSNKAGICLLCRSTQLHATTTCRSQFATTCDSSYVLQSSTPYWKSTTLYYRVLLQYYSVLQSTTPVLLCTTKYYSSTTPYYTVLIQYYSVLHSATPVLLCTTKYYSSTSLYYKVLIRYYSVLQSTTPVLVCTTKYVHTWNVIYNARSNKSQPPTSASTAPATKNDSHDQSSSHMKRNFTMRGVTTVIVQTHQILRLPRKMNLMIDPCHTWNAIYNARSNKCHCPNSPNIAPATKNESHDWSLSHMKRYLQCAEQQVSLSKLTKYCACHEKWISWLILVTHETLFTMRGVTNVIVQTHQILRLPRKMNLMIDPCHTWNATYNARSNKCHCPNSPNTAPATQNDSPKFPRNLSKTDETSFPMRGRSDHDPSMIREWSENETVRPQPASQPRLPFTPTTSILYWKIQHFALRLSFQISPNTAPATKSDTWTSPSTVPATKSNTHHWSSSHMKRYWCAE